MTPITRLEKFLAKAAGENVETPEPITRVEMFLDAIIKNSGSGLPSTEAASAGDVLSLDDNKDPKWAAPNGGGGVLVVNVTEPEADLHVCDKTAGEMLEACKTGIVVFVETSEGEEIVSVCTSANLSDGEYWFKPGTANYTYVASSSTGYPTYDDR